MEVLKIMREKKNIVSIVLFDIPIQSRWLENYTRDCMIDFNMTDLNMECPEKEGRLFIITLAIEREEIEPPVEVIFSTIGRVLATAEVIIKEKVFDYIEESNEYSDSMKKAFKYYLSYF